MVSGSPGRDANMKTKKKAMKAKAAVKRPKPAVKVARGVRALASRRTAEGKFTKVIFNQIGGKKNRRFAAMTLKKRDAVMAKPGKGAGKNPHETRLAFPVHPSDSAH